MARFASLLLLLSFAGSALGAAERMGIWIPMYVSPSPEYRKLIASVENDRCLTDSFHGTVLTGPNSGPPNVTNAAEDSLYRSYFDVVANTSQWTAFGYVTTRYMNRSLDAVLADINTWLSPGSAGYGDQVQGIWVDNTVSSFDAEAKNYYGAIAQLIRSYGKLVALNPGTNIRDCAFLQTIGTSFVNNFEDYHNVWVQTDGDRRYDCPCKEVTRCIASIHQYPADASASDVASTMRMMSARGYDAIFLTERIMPSHYSQVPAIWPLVVDSACQVVINQGNMDNAGQTSAEGTNIDPVTGQPTTSGQPMARVVPPRGHRRLLAGGAGRA